MDIKFLDAGTNEGGDMDLSPHAAPALSDDDADTCSGVIASGSYSGGGETPSGRLAGN